MVHRGAYDGQAEGDVDRAPEALVLEHRQALVVVHRQHRVGGLQVAGGEQGVRRQGRAEAHALGAQPRQGGLDHLDLLAPQVAALAGVGVEAAHQDIWIVDPEAPHQVVVQGADHLFQHLRGDGVGHGPQRQVGGGQRHAQAGAGEHHHRMAAGDLRQELGVAAEGDARIVDDPLVHRAGDQRRIAALQAAKGGAAQGLQHIAGVAGIQPPRGRGAGQRDGVTVEAARRGGAVGTVPGQQFQGQVQALGAATQQFRVGHRHQGAGPGLLGDADRQVGPDPGGLARGQGDGAHRPLSGRTST